MTRLITTLTLVVLALFSAGALTGCPKVEPGVVVIGDRYSTLAEVKPDALPYTQANIILAGSPIEVGIESKREGDELQFLIRTHGEVMELERYSSTTNTFAFVGLGEEVYSPPIPLLKFPLTTGDSWEWTGDMRLGNLVKASSAQVTTGSETLNLASGRFATILVTVTLSIDSGTKERAKRDLKFWFEPGKGLIRREFASSSTREPRPPAGAEPPARP